MPVANRIGRRSPRGPARRRHCLALAALAAIAAAALAGCVVVPAHPVYYRPMPARPYAYVVF